MNYVKINSVFKSNLIPIELETSRYQEFSNFAKSPEFLTGIFGTLTTFTVVSFFAAFILKAFSAYLQLRQINKNEETLNSVRMNPIVTYTRPNIVALPETVNRSSSKFEIDPKIIHS